MTEVPQISDIMDKLDIAAEDRLDLFDVLDADGNGTLTLGEISDGLKHLRGDPKRSDVISNGLLLRAMRKRTALETKIMSDLITKLVAEAQQIDEGVKVLHTRWPGQVAPHGAARPAPRVRSRSDSRGRSESAKPSAARVAGNGNYE